MIDSIIRNHEPQMNADKRRFIVPAIGSSLVLINANRQNNRFFAPFAYFAVKNRRLSIISFFENHRVSYELRFINEHERVSVTDSFIPGHRGHREKWQYSALSVYSVVDYLCKYSFFQKKLKNLTNSANHSKPTLKLPSNIFDDILKVGVNVP